ncbi:hypothetical protein [Pandoraea pnomenusa]|uniref:hypothetical protein n=1 Tax=Pandoraea pnomenusa TaxID=93220 RepID=UPI00333E95F2
MSRPKDVTDKSQNKREKPECQDAGSGHSYTTSLSARAKSRRRHIKADCPSDMAEGAEEKGLSRRESAPAGGAVESEGDITVQATTNVTSLHAHKSARRAPHAASDASKSTAQMPGFAPGSREKIRRTPATARSRDSGRLTEVQTLKLPTSLPREGFVVWFHHHGQYLGFAWNEAVSEIEKAHVENADHAIYFDTFAQAAVACDKFISPCRVLHSPGPGKPPKLMG